jgi:hypothetical protein
MSRYNTKAKQLGQAKAKDWWQLVKLDIEKIRGKAGADTLINEMKRQRDEIRRKG